MNCNLKTVILPESMKQIGSYAFSKNKISILKLNEGLLDIDEFAFSGNNIDEIFIPSTVEDFYTSCFAIELPLTKVAGFWSKQNIFLTKFI